MKLSSKHGSVFGGERKKKERKKKKEIKEKTEIGGT
jgi:hypothetical protein